MDKTTRLIKWHRITVSLLTLLSIGIGILGIGIGSSGCGKRQPVRTVPAEVYNSIADKFKNIGGEVTPWNPKAPDTLTVRLPVDMPPQDMEQRKIQLVADMTRRKMGGQARVFLLTPEGVLVAQSPPK